jgi:acyl-CoA thioesterase-1
MSTPVSEALRRASVLGFSLLLLCLLPAAAATANPRILVLGDSLSAANGMSLEQGWVALLEEALRNDHPQVEVVNASISGDPSAGGLRRLPPLLEKHRPQLLIIELGGNDGLRGYPTRQLEENLRSMAALAGEIGSEVIILPMEIPPNYGPRYTEAFRNSFRAAAEATGAALGPFLLEEVATDPALMQEDGIHPTVSAQPKLLAAVLPEVRSLLKSDAPS